MYNEFISQLQINAKTVRLLAKGYLPISLGNSTKITRNFRFGERSPY